ncbi:MAG: PIN domain-containing protein [Betaproteobacteria bacterium]|nr:PIN domain-containing protein [Betaproteobacteria bacterium]
MRLLLDTHLLLWTMASSRRLVPTARNLIEDPDNDVYFSAASLWEISIKSGLRRKDFTVDPELLQQALADSGFIELPVTGAHAVGVANLPAIHRDPFDRILIAQCLHEPLILVTNDTVLAGYGAVVRLV